jgi:hypothetical protein
VASFVSPLPVTRASAPTFRADALRSLNLARSTPAHVGAGLRAPRRRIDWSRAWSRARAAGILGLAALACKGDDGKASRTAGSAGGEAVSSVIASSSRPYREVAVPTPGVVHVRVTLDGDAPRDSTISPPPEQQAACGAVVPAAELARQGDALGDAVVWLPDVREGKALPVERRYELTIERCQFTPHVQVAVAGGTLNLRALDDAAHRTRFVRRGDGAQLADIATTEPTSVVPDEKVLKAPGQVEVTCSLHPWARAWLMTFDHPYAAASGADGSVRLEGVPPGRWRVAVWHERFGLREDTVVVQAGQEAELEVKLKAK